MLNTAGFLAPVVAFVPTGRPVGAVRCPIDGAIGTIPASFPDNNLWAFVVGGVLALALVLGPVSVRDKQRRRHRARDIDDHGPRDWVRKDTVYPAIAAAVVLISLVVWRHTWPGSFGTHAHSYAAILMFVCAGGFIVLTGLGATGRWRVIYRSCAGLMLVGFIAGVITTIAGSYYTVLIVEIIEATAFVLFWAVQSVHLWDHGVDTPDGAAATRDQ